MPDREMTPREAIIVLDRLNTDGRITVDRDELRSAVEVIKDALMKQIAVKPTRRYVWNYQCPTCKKDFFGKDENRCCGNCGQVFVWDEF